MCVCVRVCVCCVGVVGMCYNVGCVYKVLVMLTDQRLGFSGDQCTTTCCNVRGTIDETDGDSSWQDVLPCKKMFVLVCLLTLAMFCLLTLARTKDWHRIGC